MSNFLNSVPEGAAWFTLVVILLAMVSGFGGSCMCHSQEMDRICAGQNGATWASDRGCVRRTTTTHEDIK